MVLKVRHLRWETSPSLNAEGLSQSWVEVGHRDFECLEIQRGLRVSHLMARYLSLSCGAPTGGTIVRPILQPKSRWTRSRGSIFDEVYEAA